MHVITAIACRAVAWGQCPSSLVARACVCVCGYVCLLFLQYALRVFSPLLGALTDELAERRQQVAGVGGALALEIRLVKERQGDGPR